MNRKGYSLYELIIVLFFMSSVFLFLPKLSHSVNQQKIKNFVEIFRLDIHYSKLHSSTHLYSVKIKFYPSSHTYHMTDAKLNRLRTVTYDEALHIEPFINLNTIQIYYGRLDTTGYLVVSCGGSSYKIVFVKLGGDIDVIKQ